MLTSPDILTRSDAIAALRDFIEAGRYAPGDRLPPERELMGSLNMSRTILRKALDALEREGAIWRHVGKGTFISGSVSAAQPSLVADISQQLTPVKMMRARLSIEPAIAREAAVNASPGAIQRIRDAVERAMEAPTWEEYERQDDCLHRAIAEASDNIMLLSVFDHLNQVRRAVAWKTVIRGTDRPPRDHTSFAEHREIAAAIADCDPAGAQTAMRRHIGSVSARLFGDV
ncbi:FadR/GntR family transcriptional regulator [Thalassococcus profundi]|uniref:FadR/GntR family transcriptional regulator n=1 Tax=Thalassococcus profundi TaxID=2282382 RepID=UPI001F23CD09|nr:FCD domain-containing protein [Thalassococcus profundi]